MILTDVADGIEAAIDAIPGLRILPYLAEKIEPPGCLIGYPDQTYDIDFGDDDTWIIPIWVFVSRVSDRMARKEVSAYISRTGNKSIKTALEADKTLGGACDTLAVKRAQAKITTIGGTELLAIEFTLEVFG